MPKIYRLSTDIALRKIQRLAKRSGRSGIQQLLLPRTVRECGVSQSLVQPGIGV